MPAMSALRDILILAAMPGELAPIVRRLGLRRDGQGHRHGAVRARTLGIGPVRAVERLETLLREKRPDHVVLAGFAGGLDPALHVGDLVTLREVVSPNGPPMHLADTGSRGVSVARAAATVATKRDLHARFAADVVDMETYPVAQRLIAAGIPLTVLRAITDTAADALPPTVLQLTDRDGRPIASRIARHLATGPWRIITLLRLARASHRAGRALADAVAGHVDTLRQ